MKTVLIIFIFLVPQFGFSQDLSELYEQSNKAIVLVRTIESEVFNNHKLRTRISVEGIGSGFVISKQGDIITAAHLVQTAEQISIVFGDGEEILAKVIYSYPLADVAMVRLVSEKSTPLSVVKLGDSDFSKIGDKVFVIGAPFGLGQSLSVGYISGKYASKQTVNGYITMEFFQTDAAINKGSSGAPMFNMKGEVIGVASFIISRSQGFQGLGFATTSKIVEDFLLEEHAKWTGIESYFIFGNTAEILNLPQKGGVLVQKIAKRSLGSAMGLQGGYCKANIEGEDMTLGGDIILSIENIPLINEDNLMKAWQALQRLKSSDRLTLKVLRRGKIVELSNLVP